jgi:hypothetical protein
MDFPPGIALMAKGVRATLGNSLDAVRLWARILAALGVLASPLLLRSANLFQPVVLDQLAWTAALLGLIRLCPHGDAWPVARAGSGPGPRAAGQVQRGLPRAGPAAR